MRKTISILMLAVIVAACGGSKKEPEAANKENKTEPSNSLADNPIYAAGVELMAKSDCVTCHRASGRITGPSYEEIAAKYTGADDKKINELVATIIKGVPADKGVWGTNQQMTAHPNLSPADAKTMVQYILLLKK
jgi:cytochrome c